ncbi:MAG: hypothetical protein NVS2B8_01310 [Vulcanimicrobiaceae bacterium]
MTKLRMVAATLAALAATIPVSARADGTQAALTGPQVGEAAPAFSLTTLEGKRVDLASFAGKVLVVNVWATWCPPCRSETADLVAAEARLRRSGVAFLGVDTTEDAPIVRAFLSARGVVYPQALDRDKRFAQRYDVAYFPTTYVIDARGILRARYVDVLGAPQLAALVRDARAGRNATVTSPLQAAIDAVLADTSLAIAPGADAATVRATATRVDAAIARAEKMLDGSDAAHGNATDLLRTRAEEAALRDRALAALAALPPPTSPSPADAFDARLRGDAARDRERWSEALEAYTAALAADRNDARALEGVAFVAGRLERDDVAIEADTRLAALEPENAGALVNLARAQAKAGKAADASATFARAHAVARVRLDAHPGDAGALRTAAYAHLYAGRTSAKAGDAASARREFAQTIALAKRLPVRDARHDMYLEEGQEAIVALGLSAPQAGASVSLEPWTGPDLPGSIPGTRKFRLAVAGRSGRTIALRTSGVPKGWVASFCSDLVCAPFRTTVLLPSSGVKVVEFQLVPPKDSAPTPRVRVTSRDGSRESSATT